jgi:hypothetical protein
MDVIKENETDLKMKFAIKELEDVYDNFKWTTKFNGPLASFLDKFSDKANEYNLVKKPPTLTDDELRDQLETAIDQCPKRLKALTTVGTIERAQASIAGTATPLSFAKYYEILMETAVLADQSWKLHHPPQARQTPQQRQANKAKRDRQNRSANSTTLQASESAKIAEMKQKYGNAAAKFSIPTEIYKSLPVPVQNAFKDWRRREGRTEANKKSWE